MQIDTGNEHGVDWGKSLHSNAGVQPRLIQGIRRRDGVGEDQETTAYLDPKI